MKPLLPYGWSMSLIGELLLDVRPGFACGEDVEEGVIQFRMNNVSREGAIDWTRVRRVPPMTRNLSKYLVPTADLLFHHTNSPDLVGKCAIFPGHEEPVAFSNHSLRLRPDPKKADSGFVFRWIGVPCTETQWHPATSAQSSLDSSPACMLSLHFPFSRLRSALRCWRGRITAFVRHQDWKNG